MTRTELCDELRAERVEIGRNIAREYRRIDEITRQLIEMRDDPRDG